MAFSYSGTDAINLVREYGHGIPVTAVDSQIVDIISSMIYTRRPWKWTITQISPSIAIVDGTQDYNAPAQIYRLTRCRITDTTPTPDVYHELTIKESLPPNLTKQSHTAIQTVAMDYPTGQLRLEAAISVSAGTTLFIDGDFQANPVKWTDLNLAANFWFPDHYFNVQIEGMKWKIYQLMDDPRAGTIVIARDGRRQYSGQLGIFMAALESMEVSEDFGNSQGVIWPEDPLGAQSAYL